MQQTRTCVTNETYLYAGAAVSPCRCSACCNVAILRISVQGVQSAEPLCALLVRVVQLELAARCARHQRLEASQEAAGRQQWTIVTQRVGEAEAAPHQPTRSSSTTCERKSNSC